MLPRRICAIIGTTGVGKSNLSIALAKALNGECINGDSMQVYSGMPIITNKMPMEEREGVPHHLLGFLGREDEYLVGGFERDARGVVEELEEKGKMPVLVGGTHYYTQSLLFQQSLVSTSTGTSTSSEDAASHPHLTDPTVPTSTILSHLRSLDPAMANRWHPNDRRKILNSLRICLRTGRPHTEILKEQHGDSVEMDKKRYEKTLIFWVYSRTDELNQRLDDRVDAMITQGLFEEIRELYDFAQQLAAQGREPDCTKGVWQSIGYKEFLPYLSSNPPLNLDEETAELRELREECTKTMKASTRRYAKTQIRWIRYKLLAACKRAGIPVYLLDATDLNKWNETARDPAVSIAKSYFAGETVPEPDSLSDLAKEMLVPVQELDMARQPSRWTQKVCELCSEAEAKTAARTGKDPEEAQVVILGGEEEWKKHINSRGHKLRIKAKVKREHFERWKREKAAAEWATREEGESSEKDESP
ncbi:tRNA dimethylallyltransferase, mitochondrial [Saitoella coloradoensis]